MGLVLLVDLVERLFSIEAFYSDFGAVPRFAVTESISRSFYLSLHLMTGSTVLESILFLINAVFIICFILGYRTRLMSFLCWFFFISMSNRNPMVLHGGDVVTRSIMFWTMFIPLGIHYGVDAALHKIPYPNRKIFTPGTVGMLLQLLIVYFFSALYKTDRVWFPEGTATAYALQLESFVTKFGLFVRDFPLVLKILTLSTYFLEMLGPIYMLIPFNNMKWRIPVIIAFVGLHTGIFLTMNIGMFPWMCIAAWTIFLPTEFWEMIVPRLPRKAGDGTHIYFDADCGFCKKAVHIIRNILLIKNADISEGQSNSKILEKMLEENSWVVRTDDGNLHTKYNAFVELSRRSIFSTILVPILEFFPVRYIGEKVYRWVSNHRGAAGRITNPLLWNERVYSYNKASIWVCSIFIVFMIMTNLSGVPWASPVIRELCRTPKFLTPVVRMLRLDQKWNMFAPKPTTTNGWYKIIGTTMAGEEIVLLNEDPREDSQKPATFDNVHTTHRWSKFMRNLSMKEEEKYLVHYGRYLCRKTNRDLNGKGKLEKLTINYIWQKTSLEEKNPNPYREKVLWPHRCVAK